MLKFLLLALFVLCRHELIDPTFPKTMTSFMNDPYAISISEQGSKITKTQNEIHYFRHSMEWRKMLPLEVFQKSIKHTKNNELF